MASCSTVSPSEKTAILTNVETYDGCGIQSKKRACIVDNNAMIPQEDSTSGKLAESRHPTQIESQCNQVTCHPDKDPVQHPSVHQSSVIQRILGLSLVLGASFLNSATAAAAKYLDSISPGEFVMVRASCCVLLLLPASFYSGFSIVSFPEKRLVALRCITHGFGYTLKIWCVKNMYIGDAISIYFISVIIAGIFSRIFLKEKYTLVNATSVILGSFGVFLIAKPSFAFKNRPDSDYRSLYCLVALTAACFSGGGYTAQRAIGPLVSPGVTSLYFNVCVMVCGAALDMLLRDPYSLPQCYDERVILLICGVGSCASIVLLNMGLSIEKSASANVVRNMDVVLAFAAQVFLFKDPTDWLSMLGAGLVLSSVISVTLENSLCPHFFWQI